MHKFVNIIDLILSRLIKIFYLFRPRYSILKMEIGQEEDAETLMVALIVMEKFDNLLMNPELQIDESLPGPIIYERVTKRQGIFQEIRNGCFLLPYPQYEELRASTLNILYRIEGIYNSHYTNNK